MDAVATRMIYCSSPTSPPGEVAVCWRTSLSNPLPISHLHTHRALRCMYSNPPKAHTTLRRLAVQRRTVFGGAPGMRLYEYRYIVKRTRCGSFLLRPHHQHKYPQISHKNHNKILPFSTDCSTLSPADSSRCRATA